MDLPVKPFSRDEDKKPLTTPSISLPTVQDVGAEGREPLPALTRDGQPELVKEEGPTSRLYEHDEKRGRLFDLLNEMPGIVYLRAPDYAIHFANRRFRERFGDPTAEPCYKLIHNRSTPCEPCGCAKALAEGHLLESEWAFADGTSYQLYDYPFVDVDGVEKVLHLGIETTKCRQAEAELARANRELLAMGEAERRERILAESLAQAALALNSSLDLAQVLDRILEQTLRVVPSTAASVMLVDNQQIQLVRQRGLESRPSVELARLEAGVPLETMPRLEAAWRERQPMLIDDTSQDPRFRLANGLGWVRSLVALPMIHEGSVAGFIILFSDWSGFFTQDSFSRLESFANHAALAIGNARIYQRMKESRAQLQSLSRRLVEVQENERKHVARELHDEVGQALTSLMIQLRLLKQDATDPERVEAGVTEIIGEVDRVMENLHRLAMDLRPASLDHLGLTAALEQHCRVLEKRHPLRATFEAIGIEGRMAPDVETAIYRIVQEALNNVIRHSQATRADVLLERCGNRIMAIVEDDGQGFKPEVPTDPDHLGLVGIQERATALGGSLTIESSPGEGTTLFVEVPNAYPSSDSG
jgi:signal transduction histidine kinase